MDVIYSVTAIVDLIGFSSHLELGAYDFRTNIGKEAISRLNILEDAIKLFEKERNNVPDVYPEKFFYKRINDSLILTLDLPEFLTPSVGQTIKRGISAVELDKYFPEEGIETEEELLNAYRTKHYDTILNLLKFVGFIGRLHQYINSQENNKFYPGAKSIVSTGYRLPFITEQGDDCFSANFSFSNAYIAEKYLKGPKLYLDTNIIEMLSFHKMLKNIFQYACIEKRFNIFNPFEDHNEDTENLPSFTKELNKYELNILRKVYEYREINPFPLTYFQIFDRIKDYLENKKYPNTKLSFLHSIFDSIRTGLDSKKLERKEYKGFLINSLKTDLEEDIRILIELIEGGNLKTMEMDNKMPINILPNERSR